MKNTAHNRCLAIWRKRTYRLPPHRQAPKRYGQVKRTKTQDGLRNPTG